MLKSRNWRNPAPRERDSSNQPKRVAAVSRQDPIARTAAPMGLSRGAAGSSDAGLSEHPCAQRFGSILRFQFHRDAQPATSLGWKPIANGTLFRILSSTGRRASVFRRDRRGRLTRVSSRAPTPGARSPSCGGRRRGGRRRRSLARDSGSGSCTGRTSSPCVRQPLPLCQAARPY
jgi:hypothetical protein